MIVEMRIYHCLPGRLPALHDRFIKSTLGFFEKHGIVQIGFWTTLAGPSNHALTYLLQWESLAERETRWNAFQADPEWIAKRAESEATQAIVERIENHFLTPTSYSALR
ncbi:NIPSNAP family protein [Verminephrobacter eiseniae]|uniref:NIPSNAP family containing protein n=1 Tax=Verminephrobacter eiseniae (strain EF01-2) TaxID=391735 RepID=A1WM47_VEREI|nr:NIPSNAP family protein [Verminephrobacter eiseniae]KAB7560249.1 NIPSNAP family protein [Verminephrobacter sp. Larva24]ABM58704.1 NIPSNAP family containing protein [Verminephrobacter eiseniae EF01-2]MCW5230752.1 NIPSNAP family protein [Verminephrobacter eiseniae]MCW5238333.1 NIPSNAP family protein [Verminephrobacter eiseniae]MCW5259136.1 NIPSNAP family protein [Verminephrobacter eiseniae]